MKSKKIEKRIHFFLGISLFAISLISIPFALTGNFILENSPIKLNFLPALAFLVAIFEIYHGIKLK